MTVSATWTNPSAAGTLDLSAGTVVTETHWDAMVSNFLYLGGPLGAVTQLATNYRNPPTTLNTTSATPSTIAQLDTNITTTGGVVLMFVTINYTLSSGAQNAVFYPLVDAGTISGSFNFNTVTAGTASWMAALTGLSAALHTIHVQWSVSGGATLALNTTNTSSIILIELRR